MTDDRPADGPAATGTPITVLIADDQRVVREGLAMVLGLLPDIEVVGAASDGNEAVELATDLRPDIVLMDLRMPRCDGVEATRQLRERLPEARVVVLTTYSDDRSVLDALRAGARGYLTKDAGADEIRQALRRVREDGAALDPTAQRHLIDAITSTGTPDPNRDAHREPDLGPDLASASTTPSPTPPPHARAPLPDYPDGLTRRETEVLTLIAAGLSNAEIAARLVVSESTVKSHINRLLAKIDARDRAQAVAYAYRNGLAP